MNRGKGEGEGKRIRDGNETEREKMDERRGCWADPSRGPRQGTRPTDDLLANK